MQNKWKRRAQTRQEEKKFHLQNVIEIKKMNMKDHWRGLIQRKGIGSSIDQRDGAIQEDIKIVRLS